MKKYLAFVPFLLLVLVVMSSGCTDGTTTVSNSTFNESGITFEYPSTWSLMTTDEIENVSVNPSNAVGGIKSEDSDKLIVIHKFPANGASLSELKTNMQSVYASDNISTISTVEINGKDALVATFTYSNFKVKIIVILVGDNFYTIEMQSDASDYADQEALFNSIQDSIQIS